ncbi:hypothetical protein KJ854_01310 [Patescibacteria group bacterium]|nr:hypothetical protein [Patescibacteria group bacterium]
MSLIGICDMPFFCLFYICQESNSPESSTEREIRKAQDESGGDEMTVYQRDDKLFDTDYLMALAIACQKIPLLEQPNYGTVDG